MGDILFHAVSSAKQFKCTPEDVLGIHRLLDSSKHYLGDWRHRALYHHTFGIDLCVQKFGETYIGPSGATIHTATIAQQHILEDLGVIPTPEQFIRHIPLRNWMQGFDKDTRKQLQGSLLHNPHNKVTTSAHWIPTVQTPPKPGIYQVATAVDTFFAAWTGTQWVHHDLTRLHHDIPLSSLKYWLTTPACPVGDPNLFHDQPVAYEPMLQARQQTTQDIEDQIKETAQAMATITARMCQCLPSDLIHIHRFLEQGRRYLPDFRHRVLLYHTAGIDLCEQFFGDIFTAPSNQTLLCTRTIATKHIQHQMGGVLPTPDIFLAEMPLRSWMNGVPKEQRANFVQSRELYPCALTASIEWNMAAPERIGWYFAAEHHDAATPALWRGEHWEAPLLPTATSHPDAPSYEAYAQGPSGVLGYARLAAHPSK